MISCRRPPHRLPLPVLGQRGCPGCLQARKATPGKPRARKRPAPEAAGDVEEASLLGATLGADRRCHACLLLYRSWRNSSVETRLLTQAAKFPVAATITFGSIVG